MSKLPATDDGSATKVVLRTSSRSPK